MPFVLIRKADGKIGAGAGKMQCREPLAVQPSRTLVEVGVMRVPCSNRIVEIDARGGKDRIGQLGDGRILGKFREDLPRQDGLG